MFKAFSKVFFLISSPLLCFTAYAQNGYVPPINWQKQLPANSASATPAAIGTSLISTGNELLVNYSGVGKAGFIMRTTLNGDVNSEASKQGLLSGSYSKSFAYRNQVTLSADNTLFFAGSGTSPLNPLEPEQSVILKKKSFGSPSTNQDGYVYIPGSDAAIGVCALPDNGYAVLYRTFRPAGGSVNANWDLNIARYTKADQLVFNKAIIGIGNEYGTAIKYDSDGHLYVIGYTDQKFSDANGSFDGTTGNLPGTFLIRLDMAGKFEWVRTIDEEASIDIAQTPDGNIYTLTAGGNKINIQKYTRSGQLVYKKMLVNTRSAGVETDSLTSGLTALSDSNLLFYYNIPPSNSSDSTYTGLTKLDGANGSTIWSRTIGTRYWSETYQVIETAGRNLVGIGGIRTTSGDVTADPTTYSDMRTWLYEVGPYLETNNCNSNIDTSLTVTGATTGCGGSVTLAAATGLSYEWYKDGVVINNATSNELIVTGSGSYKALLTNVSGCLDSTRAVDVTISEPIDTALTVSGPTSLCGGGSVTLTAAPNLSYQWYKDNNAILGSTSQSITITSSGIYKVILSNATGCKDTSRSVNVSAVSVIDTTLTISGPTELCPGQTVVISVPANMNYQWYRNGAPLLGQTKNQLTVSIAGVYLAIITAGAGCSDTTRTVPVTYAPAIDTSVTANGPTILCSSAQTVTLSAAAGLTYQWYKDGTAITNQTAQQYTATTTGGYSVVLHNNSGCADTSRTVAVSLGAALDTALAVSGSTVLCGGQSVVFTAAAGLTYKWYKNNIAIIGATSRQYTASSSGSYFAILSAAGGCTDTTRSVAVDVAEAIDTTLTVTGSTALCNQDAVQLVAAAGLTYQWFKDGTAISNATSQILTANTPGGYKAVLSNGIGCVDSTRLVTVTNANIDTSVALSGSPIVCAGQTVTMTAKAGLSYQWYLDGVAIGGATSRSYTATVTGGYQVSLQTQQGCTDTSRTIAIIISNNVTGSISPATASLCNNTSVALTATGGSEYQWYRDGQIIQNATGSVYTASQPGEYSVAIFNAGGCSGTAQNTVNIQNTVLDTSITVNGATAVCAGQAVALAAGTASSYQWLLNGSAIAGATAKQYSATAAGSYQVAVTNAEGCKDTTRTIAVSISASPTAAIQVPTSTVLCTGTSIQLTASGGPSYTWYRDNVAIPNASAATYTASLPGSYTVIVANGGGCKDTSNAVVLAAFAKPVPGFNATAGCVGADVPFINTSTIPGNATAIYRWDFGDNSGSADKDPSHVFTAQGTYEVKLVVSLTGCQGAVDSITKSVTIGTTGAGTRYPTVSLMPGNTTTIAAREGGTTYTWSPTTGLGAPTSRVTNITLTSSQEYTVLITQTAGCAITDTVLVSTTAGPGQTQVFVPTGFTPNSNGRNDLLRPMLINFSSIKYFRVYNRWGKLVYQTSSIGAGWDGRINGVPQPTETYSWIFEGQDNSGKTVKTSGKTVLIR